MKAIGIVFLFDRSLGAPEVVSKKFSEYFSGVSENLVNENLIGLLELKEIIDLNRIFWGGIKENFNEIANDTEAIGKISWQVFNNHTGIDANDEIKSLVYDGEKSPWKFTLMASIIYA